MFNDSYVIRIAGIAHADPLGPRKLRVWFTSLKGQESSPPAFIGVEWDKNVFRDVVAQRPKYRSLISQKWPQVTAQFLDELVKSLGYEGDSHIGIFPGVETLWLDQGRSNHMAKNVQDFAKDRVDWYEKLGASFPFEIGNLLSMSQAVWASLGDPSDPSVRDQHFAGRILQKCLQHEPFWAVAIVGVHHTLDKPGYMVEFLRYEGLTVSVSKLCS